MIDSHCHIAGDEFAHDRAEVIARARGAGVTLALCVVEASDAPEAVRAGVLCREWEELWLAAGVHPHRAAAEGITPDSAAARVRNLVDSQPKVRALGEIGLDYHYEFAPHDVQQAVFASQVALAASRGLPLVVHTREADADTLRILREAGGGRACGVFHCFSGDVCLAEQALELGFFVSFSGILTFKNAGTVRAAAAAVPLDRLLVETDSPYLAPPPHRGRRNEPAFVTGVAVALAAIKGVTLETLDAAVTANFCRLFSIPEPVPSGA